VCVCICVVCVCVCVCVCVWIRTISGWIRKNCQHGYGDIKGNCAD